MKEEDVIASLKELADHSDLLLDIIETRIKELKFHCWKYNHSEGAERLYYEHAEMKKIYNILKYLYGGHSKQADDTSHPGNRDAEACNRTFE